jgi:hypothetical protein
MQVRMCILIYVCEAFSVRVFDAQCTHRESQAIRKDNMLWDNGNYGDKNPNNIESQSNCYTMVRAKMKHKKFATNGGKVDDNTMVTNKIDMI